MTEDEKEYRRHKAGKNKIMLVLIILGLCLICWIPTALVIVGVSSLLFAVDVWMYKKERQLRATVYPYDQDSDF